MNNVKRTALPDGFDGGLQQSDNDEVVKASLRVHHTPEPELQKEKDQTDLSNMRISALLVSSKDRNL